MHTYDIFEYIRIFEYVYIVPFCPFGKRGSWREVKGESKLTANCIDCPWVLSKTSYDSIVRATAFTDKLMPLGMNKFNPMGYFIVPCSRRSKNPSLCGDTTYIILVLSTASDWFPFRHRWSCISLYSRIHSRTLRQLYI